MTVRSQIPVARAWVPRPPSPRPPRQPPVPRTRSRWRPLTDGHPENAAASVFGGLVAASTVGALPVHVPLALSDVLAFVVVIPERDLATPVVCGVLPEEVPMTDVVFNLGHMGLLVAGLADPDVLVPEAMEDRIHQPARTTLFPEAPELLRALVDAGVARGQLVRGGTDAHRRGASGNRRRRARWRRGRPGGGAPRWPRPVLQADRRGLVYGDEAEVESTSHLPSDVPNLLTSPCSWVMAELTLNVLRTWL